MSRQYPPLVSLEIMPLHSGIAPGAWACRARPEMTVRDVRFDWRCLDCAQAAVGFVDAGQDVMVDWRKRADDYHDHGPVKLSWMAARAMYWLRLPGRGDAP